MGYFPNGTSGEMYYEGYCAQCIHEDGRHSNRGCPIWAAHLIHNYAECNKDDSILHMLIPRDKDGWNEECAMFVPVGGKTDKDWPMRNGRPRGMGSSAYWPSGRERREEGEYCRC